MKKMTLAKIVYASMTGNTEEISEIIENALSEKNIDVEREEVDDVEVDFFDDADLCIIATYTYGEGELPDEFEEFYEELGDKDLNGKIYGVVGSGDREYEEHFCRSAHDFDKAFAKTGALKGAEVVEIENNAEEEDIEQINQFIDSLLSK